MTIEIEHRPDRLLDRAVNEECPADLKGTFIERVTWPAHRVAYQFLEEKVVSRSLVDREELQRVLDEWADFATEHGLPGSKEFARLSIRGDRIYFPSNSPAGGLDIAIIK